MRSLKLLVAIAALCLFGGPALAAMTLTLSGPTGDVPVSRSSTDLAPFTVTAAYALSGDYDNVALTLNIPQYVSVVAAPTYETGTFTAVTYSHPNSSVARTCTLTASSMGSISGTVEFSLYLDRHAWKDGAPVTFSATLTATQGSAPTPPIVAFTAKPSHDLRWSGGGAAGDFLTGGQLVYFRKHPSTGATGLLYTFAYSLTNSGSARIDAGATITATFPNNVTFVGAWQTGNPTTAPYPQVNNNFVIAAPTAWTTGGTLTYTALNALGFGQGTAATWSLVIEAWVPCSSIPDGTGRNIAMAASAKSTKYDGSEHPYVLSSSRTPHSLATSGGECGTGGSFAKTVDTTTGPGQAEGTTVGWALALQPKKGVLSYQDVLVQDRLPTGLQLSPSPTVSPSDFTFYSCALPGVQTKLTLAQFQTHKNASTPLCTPGVRADATHVVLYAPTWGDGATINGLNAGFRTYVPLGFVPSGATYPYTVTNSADVDARQPVDEGSPIDYTATASANRALTDKSKLVVTGDPVAGSPIQIGVPYTVRANFRSDAAGYATAAQAALDITVPLGVTVTGVRSVFGGQVSSTTCTEPGFYANPIIGTNPLHWSFGNAQFPEFLTCTVVEVDIIVPRTGTYKQGDPLAFVLTPTAANTTSALSVAKTFTYTLTAPPEMRVALEPGCHDGDQPSLFMIASNTGGQPLTNVVSRVAIPADTTFAGLGPVPSGATVYYYDLDGDPIVVSDPVQYPLVKAIALGVSPLDAGADPVELEVKLSTSTSGTWSTTATMSATELAQTSASLEQDTGVCPAAVTITKFFDDNRDGSKALTGEPQLARWQFTVRQGDNPIRTVTTYQSGAVVTRLNPGSYTVTETLPTDTQGTWIATTTGGVTQPVVAAQHGTNALLFGNDCNCPDDGDGNACTQLVCQSNGSCAPAFAAAGTSCNDKTACTTTDICNAVGVCAGTALTCNDNNTCTTDSCNPATGCVYTNQTGTSCVLNACTDDATCNNGVCQGGTPKVCNDNNPCTLDVCNLPSGCDYSGQTPVNDNNACTLDACTPEAGVTHTPISYDDADACTLDACDPITGISHADQTPAECAAGGQVIWGSMFVGSAPKAFRCVVEGPGEPPECEVDNDGALVPYPPVCE